MSTDYGRSYTVVEDPTLDKETEAQGTKENNENVSDGVDDRANEDNNDNASGLSAADPYSPAAMPRTFEEARARYDAQQENPKWQEPAEATAASNEFYLQLSVNGHWDRRDKEDERLGYSRFTPEDGPIEPTLFELRKELTAELHKNILELRSTMSTEDWNRLANDAEELASYQRQDSNPETKWIEWGRHTSEHREGLEAIYELQCVLEPWRKNIDHQDPTTRRDLNAWLAQAELNDKQPEQLEQLTDLINERTGDPAARAFNEAIERLIPSDEHRTLGPIDYNSKDEGYAFTLDNLASQLDHVETFKNIIAYGLERGTLTHADYLILDQAGSHLEECIEDLMLRIEDHHENEELADQDDVEGERRLTNYLVAITHLERLTTGTSDFERQADRSQFCDAFKTFEEAREKAVTGRENDD